MPGARSSRKPAAASPSASDECLLLEIQLQQQLEEDVARIFDESIYSDIEVVCGKLKLLTHTCILKARTKKFYHKLETILHLNIGRNTFDEIYSFISDTYTECNIKRQEKEIIAHINDTFSLIKYTPDNSWNSKEDIVEPEVFLTPKCTSPHDEKEIPITQNSTPSTELTKEYYALVPIDGNLLDKELMEQDVLSNAFQSIIKSQTQEEINVSFPQCIKPTSLSLNSSQTSQTVKHSNSCDILNSTHLKDNIVQIKKTERFNVAPSQNSKISDPYRDEHNDYIVSKKIESVSAKFADPTYSPDSLITDDPSSSSDYLSAVYTCSPGIDAIGCHYQLNVGHNIANMDNVFTSSDSGLENTGLLESLTSHKDVTLADASLTESTLFDLTADDASNSHDSVSSPTTDKYPPQRLKLGTLPQVALSGNCSEIDFNCFNTNSTRLKENVSCKSSKEEKQRQNEEIVILESSSLSSETGSWESVFPPKLAEKDICEKFLNNERQYFNHNSLIEFNDQDHGTALSSSLVQKSPFKSTGCFIDAASLADEEDETIKICTEINVIENNIKTAILPLPSQPVPCCTNKQDMSPNDWSEGNENDDSLEQAETKDSDSVQKDLSPTIFEMTLLTDDSSLGQNMYELNRDEDSNSKKNCNVEEISIDGNIKNGSTRSLLFSATTPHNSIMSLNGSSMVQYESVTNLTTSSIKLSEKHVDNKTIKKSNESPIISGGASIEDHLPQITNYNSLTRRTLENIPIVSGAYTPPMENINSNKVSKPSCSSAWVVDMSNNKISNEDVIVTSTPMKPGDKVCESLKATSKLSSSLESCNKNKSSGDSDSSEKSYHKFYIDLATLSDSTTSKDDNHNTDNTEKKNMFSMYIDLGENSTLKEMPARLTSSLNIKRSTCVEHEKNKNVQKSRKRGKTSVDCSLIATSTKNDSTYESLSNESNLSTSDISSLRQGNDKNSTQNVAVEKYHSLGDLQTTSVSHPDSKISYATELKETKLQTELVSNNDSTFEKYESLCNDPNISISEIISLPQRNYKNSTQEIPEVTENSISDLKKKTVSASKISDTSALADETTVKPSTDLFVKLSDLDKPIQKCETPINSNEAVLDVRMTRSIPENNWGGQNHNSTSIPIEVISSFHSENAVSLNRLFPHLKNEFSRSMPGSLSARTRSSLRLGASSSPGDADEPSSDMSEISSVQSSMCRSVVENSTTEETSQTLSLIGSCQSRLGQDLLRMFLEEIAPDVIVEVSGRRIKAHKCILSSRCQYFAGILSGGWVESAGNVILLPPFAFNVVHFTLCHIYSGAALIPDSISIVELATIADMLGLEGLKEAIMYTLKSKYCHHFHWPCSVCTLGVLECFPLSSLYGLDDLCHKCLRWITKHFSRVWPTRAFAALPADLSETCYQQHIINMSEENVVETIYGCGIIISSLKSNSRGADIVERLCRRLMNASAEFIAPRLDIVVRTLSPPPSNLPEASEQALSDCINVAIERAPGEQLCRLYEYLFHTLKQKEQYVFYSQACTWRVICERTLVRAAPRVVRTQAFKDLPLELSVRLRKLGCIMFGIQSPITTNSSADRRRSPNKDSRDRSQSRNVDINDMKARFTPYTCKPVYANPASNVREKVHQSQKTPVVRTTKAQEERAKYNMAKCSTSVQKNTRPKRAEAKHKLTAKVQSSSESSRQVSETKGYTVSQDSLATSSRPRTAEPCSSHSDSLNIKYATYTKSKRTNVENQADNSKMKTKIPVYVNNKACASNKNARDADKKDTTPKSDRRFGSLMMATKSSSAKIVQRQITPSRGTSIKPKNTKSAKHNGKVEQTSQRQAVPSMDRSGTFSKDEPTFGDRMSK
ncbi:uncharacterized protein LOC131855128 [Achroia grisella]|uniref:uncharacterized protein LOC131855128 n=1 Tax=Achroia grisella TaxID=688607 RepID=UPI0027D24CB4|nr:uncharacterized protein LOC131855128 [Achroia grisella]